MTGAPIPPTSDGAALAVQLAVINTKLDTLILQRDDHETRLRHLEKSAESDEHRADTENRLRRLEQFRWLLMGACVASGPVTAAIASRM